MEASATSTVMAASQASSVMAAPQASSARADPQASSVMAASRVSMSDLNGRSYNLLTTKVSSVDNKLQYILSNPKMTAPIQIGLELRSCLQIIELASSTLTG